MIQAEIEPDEDRVRVEVSGDRDQYEDELTAILVHALSTFTEDEIIKMLADAVNYRSGATAPGADGIS